MIFRLFNHFRYKDGQAKNPQADSLFLYRDDPLAAVKCHSLSSTFKTEGCTHCCAWSGLYYYYCRRHLILMTSPLKQNVCPDHKHLQTKPDLSQFLNARPHQIHLAHLRNASVIFFLFTSIFQWDFCLYKPYLGYCFGHDYTNKEGHQSTHFVQRAVSTMSHISGKPWGTSCTQVCKPLAERSWCPWGQAQGPESGWRVSSESQGLLWMQNRQLPGEPWSQSTGKHAFSLNSPSQTFPKKSKGVS